MASRLIHLAIALEIIKEIKFNDNNRFLLGQLLPDANINENNAHNKTHFVKFSEDNKSKVYDFTSFYRLYKSEIDSNEIYLGYYIHIIEDVLFRKSGYEKWKLLEHRNDDDFRKKIYNDYSILNKYLIEKYQIPNFIEVVRYINTNSINSIYSFDVKDMLNQLDNDFKEEVTDGKLNYLRLELVDEFIKESSVLCIKEIKNIINSKETLLDSNDFYWLTKE